MSPFYLQMVLWTCLLQTSGRAIEGTSGLAVATVCWLCSSQLRCGMLSQLTVLHRSHVADALPALSPFQRSFQQLAPPEPEHRGAQYRPVTPLQTAVRAILNLTQFLHVGPL